jgi:phage terminase large subunit-like protein
MRCAAASLALLPSPALDGFLDSLTRNALAAFPWLFEFWAIPGHQLPPAGDWSTWVILGGRGAGKTRAGAEWVRAQVEGATPEAPGAARRIALVAETIDQARDVMVLGESGLLACSPPDRRPEFQISRRRLIWPNGAEAQLFSAKDPESLRGPQFDLAWSDELGKWRRAREAWDMLQFGLRLGQKPRQIVTTTPRRNPVLIELLDDPATVSTSAPTSANRANLAPDFLAKIVRRYEGTALGRQELGGELLTDLPGALWSRETLEACRVRAAPSLSRIVVAVDPPVTGRQTSDSCGIVVAGAVMDGDPQDWTAYVLADLTVKGRTPRAWAERAVEAFRTYNADRLVAEVNQGGDLVEAVVRQVDPRVAYKGVHARRGKILRAEPVSALYEQGRVRHVGAFPQLEDQMCAFSQEGLRGLNVRSPDRVDALVWAITELMLGAAARAVPKVRGL